MGGGEEGGRERERVMGWVGLGWAPDVLTNLPIVDNMHTPHAHEKKVCDARFIGPESVTRPLQEKLYRHVGQWSVRAMSTQCVRVWGRK